MESIIKQIYAQAKLIGACPRFTGQEKTLDDIVALFTSMQGMEFCIKYHFPNIATFRLFKPYGVDKQYGIYIDAGTITLKNPARAILIGRTIATIYCDECEMHDITLLHGAKAVVNASKWAVVKTTVENGCNLIRSTSENAIIL
ncbi:hypothetical protein [Bacteroides sp.]|uniref:hypothetical protein n=1 Tax=Bacteroides sp. TaxID=29523 RepID=UPI002A82ADFE|nr:hypothetical protein [Bacteroides sp.]